MLSRQNGFTLLEICLALMIGLLLITLAVPSVLHAMAEQRLRRTFEAFDTFVQDARMRSVREQHDITMRWDEKGITITVSDPTGQDSRRETDSTESNNFAFAKGEEYTLARPAALMKDPPTEWTFWKDGICEPAQISFHGAAGNWIVKYNPLTAHGEFLESGVE